MQSLTSERPKPMLEVGGKPMLEHVLDRLREAGVIEALLVTGYHGGLIESHFAAYPMRCVFERQEPVNGTGRAALLARDFAGGSPFLLTFGDILAPASEYAGMIARFAADPAADAVIAVKHVPDPYQGAAVYESGGVLTRIVEKPGIGTSATNWNSAGIFIFRPSIFDELARLKLSPRGEYELTGAIAALVESGRRVLSYELTGPWRDVGRPEDLAAARTEA